VDRALLLHAIAAPAEDTNALADRPVGERNAALLRLHEALAGDALQSSVDCPRCDERLEFSLSAGALRADAGSPPSSVTVGGFVVRVPTTRDLASITGELDEDAAAHALLDRLVVSAATAGTSLQRPDADEVIRALEAADPCADLTVALTCPACAHDWHASLDVAAFVWDEIEVRARRFLDEVHVLAHAYGWTEAEILRLPESRRSAYLERALA
jgi:hypothetical protein